MAQSTFNKQNYKGLKYSTLEEAMIANRASQIKHCLENKEKIKQKQHDYYLKKVKPIKSAEVKQHKIDKISNEKLRMTETPLDELSYYLRVTKPKNDLKNIAKQGS